MCSNRLLFKAGFTDICEEPHAVCDVKLDLVDELMGTTIASALGQQEDTVQKVERRTPQIPNHGIPSCIAL